MEQKARPTGSLWEARWCNERTLKDSYPSSPNHRVTRWPKHPLHKRCPATLHEERDWCCRASLMYGMFGPSCIPMVGRAGIWILYSPLITPSCFSWRSCWPGFLLWVCSLRAGCQCDNVVTLFYSISLGNKYPVNYPLILSVPFIFNRTWVKKKRIRFQIRTKFLNIWVTRMNPCSHMHGSNRSKAG